MTYINPIGSFKYRVDAYHLSQAIDDIGTPVTQWVLIRPIWVSLKPTHNYKRNQKELLFQQLALPHYRLTARSNIFYATEKGKIENIWDFPFQLRYKDNFLIPLVSPSIDISKKWISVIVQSRPVNQFREKK